MANTTTTTRAIQTDGSVFQRCERHANVSLLDAGSQAVRIIEDDAIMSDSESPRSPVHRIRALKSSFRLPNVSFIRWKKSTKKSCPDAESILSLYYKPIASVRKPLLQQIKEILLTQYHGDYSAFQNGFLDPVGNLLHSIQVANINLFQRKSKIRRKQIGWPLCSRGCVIVQLAELDHKHLRNGDFYFLAHPELDILLTYKTDGFVHQRSLDVQAFIFLMADMVSSTESAMPSQNEEEEEDDDNTMAIEQDLSRVLNHLMVTIERGIRRIERGQVVKELWMWNGHRNRKHRTATRDSWVQTNPSEDLQQNATDQSPSTTAPLASEEEFSSDSEAMRKRSVLSLACSESSLESSEEQATKKLNSDSTSVCHLDENVTHSKIALLPGCRDLCGRSIVYLCLQKLVDFPSTTYFQIAQQILYFTTVPKREVSRLGLLLLVDARDASSQECDVFEQCLSCIETCAPRTVNLVLVWQKQNQKSIVQPTSPLHRTHIRFESIVNVNQLLKYVRRNQLLPEFGGSYLYDHQDWTEFHKVLDPFMSECRLSGHHLLSVMRELRSQQLPPSSSLSSAMIEHHKKQIEVALKDEQLRHLEKEGDNLLATLYAHQKKAPHNHDYKESVEKCNLLFRQLKKILQRLTKLADKRLGRLQECMILRTFEEESSQVLSWLCHKGDETLKRHQVLAENLHTIREQENEFEKFYFLAMRQIERGNDLLDEAPRPKVVSSAGVNGMTSVLKSQLEEFTERLEDAREKLENSRRCYHLLDQSYEWALETMGVVSGMKRDPSTSLEDLVKRIQQLEDYFGAHPPFKEETFNEMLSLCKKLNNERLRTQCEVAKKKCEETITLVQDRLAMLRSTKLHMEEQTHISLTDSCKSLAIRPTLWMPALSNNMPYRSSSNSYLHRGSSLFGSQQILREPTGSYTSFPSSYYPVSRASLLKDNLAADDDECKKRAMYCSTENCHDIPCTAGAVRDALQHKRLSLDHTWKGSEDELDRTTRQVRQQNNQLQQLSQRIHHDDSDNDLPDDKPETLEPQRPAPVNLHLLRCASCSDFEELLSTKNAEMEAEKKTKKILKLIMREMIQTERDYVKSLRYIIENYVPLLQKSDIPQTLRGQRNVLFGNIEKIFEFHDCYFLQELEHCDASAFAVGQCFLKYEPQFYLYALYNKNKPKSDDLMTEYGSSFFREKQCELGDKMDLASYLLKPVQRMGKYALLLKQLLKECPENDSYYSDLKAAEEMVHFQLRHGNDLLAMDALRECDVNVKEQGRLLRQEEFLVWQGKSRKTLRHLFLFEDLILFSKARTDPLTRGHDIYQYKQSIKTSDIGLTEQVGDTSAKFEIWFRKRKGHDIYTLQAPSAEVKKAWVQDISKLLWKQALRNRELRLAEMSSMGIGNKPCLDIGPSQDQICDRSITFQQLNKAPRFRNSIAISGCDNFVNTTRPQSMISVISTTSSNSTSSSSGPVLAVPTTLIDPVDKDNRRFSMAQQSQCSGESGIFTDASMSGDSYTEHEIVIRKEVTRSDSILSHSSLTTIPDDS